MDDRGFNPHIWQHSFIQIGHAIISSAILSLPLIQKGQLSVTGERMCSEYVNSVDRLTDRAQNHLKSIERP